LSFASAAEKALYDFAASVGMKGDVREMMREDLPMQGGGGEEVCEYGGRPSGEQAFTGFVGGDTIEGRE
jgi:hypothetical protein